MTDKICNIIIAIAAKEVGTAEIGSSNCGPRVNLYKAATTLDPSLAWAWCAAFVDWSVEQAMAVGVAAGAHYTFQRPTTAGAWDLENWSLAQDDSTRTRRNPGHDILPGDIIIYNFHHTGIATSAPDADGDFHTIEGNTDDGGSRDGGAVWRKVRRVSQVKTRIRFTV